MSGRVVGCLVAAALVAGTSAPGAAQTDERAVDIVLTDQSFAVAPDEPWRVEFEVTGPLPAVVTATTTTSAPTATTTTATSGPVAPAPDAELRVLAGRPVASRAELAEVLAGDRAAIADIVVLPLVLTTRGVATTLTAQVPTATRRDVDGALSLIRPGLHPITVQIVVDDDIVAEHDTFLERLPIEPGDGAAMNVVVAAATADPGPILDAAERDEGRRQLSLIADTASAVDGPISVAIPPVLLDDIADDDPLGDTLRTALEGDEVLALPATALDPSSAVAVNEQAVFTRELLEGEAILGRALPDEPPRRSAWIADSAVSTGAAIMLRNLAFRSLVLPAARYEELDGNIGGFHDTTLTVDIDLGDGARFPAMVVAPVADLLDPATLERRGVDPTDAAVQIAAWLVTVRRELGDDQRRSAVLQPPGSAVPDPAVSAALAGFVAGLPDIALTPLSAVPGGTDAMLLDGLPHTVTLPDVAGPDLDARARRIDLTRVAAESSGSMFLDDTQLVEWRTELDGLLSTGLADAEVDVALQRISSEVFAVRDCVEAPQPFTFTLTGRSSPLRLNVRNTCDERLQVMVRPSSPKLTFPDGSRVVVVEPNDGDDDGAEGTVTEVVIPVEARSNGTSSLEVDLLTPVFEQQVEPPLVLTARVNALTGLGQVVTGGALLVLVSWWYGHFRRRRRRRLAAVGDLDGSSLAPDAAPVSPDAAEAAVVRAADEPRAGSLTDP